MKKGLTAFVFLVSLGLLTACGGAAPATTAAPAETTAAPAAETTAAETTAEETTAEEPQSEGAAEEPASDEEPLTDDDLKKFADDMVSKIKGLVAEGNVSRIRIRKGDTIILNLPLSVGLIGTALGLVAAPWAVILGTISTIGFKCTVEVEKKDGTVTIIHGKES